MAVPVPRLKTYDLRGLILNFGTIGIKGFGPSDFLTIRPVKPRFTSIEGLHGKEIPIMSKSHKARASITIMRESDNNASLSIISALDQVSGLGIFPFLASYLNLTQIYTSVQSRVVKEPDVTFSAKNGYMTWELELYRLVRFG